MLRPVVFVCVCWLTGYCLAGDDDAASTNVAHSEIQEAEVTSMDREHWAFLPITRPPIPVLEDPANWQQTSIDALVLEQLQSKQLVPSEFAPRHVVLRRLKLDLLGLPPTPEELAAFEQDPRNDAYERRVDEFLASPAYGERWAQHWLDLARFAETDGFEHDRLRPTAWQYRQWIIDAINRDMPYDQFVREQLAGDLDQDATRAIATMFCLAGPDMPDLNDQDQRRHDKLNELTGTIGAVILGLQFQCAQCHDHKYDPISQGDFYRLRSIFESAIPELERDKGLEMLTRLSGPVSARFYFRGELSQPGPEMPPAPPRVACTSECELTLDEVEGRRQFCDWLFDWQNPLTSRVISNRLWQHHFGQGLCENPSDFGMVPSEPSHPALLDYLADELRQSHWSLKSLHRQIVCSATYRQSGRQHSGRSQDAGEVNQRLYQHYPRHRLEGEVIRDCLLAASGRLDLRYGGESVLPPLPEELQQTLLKGQWVTSKRVADHDRRSIYVFARRNLRYPLLDVFDRPDAGATCPIRNRSTTAIQSLQMLNGDIAFSAAQDLRDRLFRECYTDESSSPNDSSVMLERLFLLTFARRPDQAELQRFREYLTSSGSADRARWLTVCVAVLNASEFVYVE
jgi:hypothetical protein